MGFGLEIGFIEHFRTRLVTTLNYNSLTGLHSPQITVTAARMFFYAFSSQAPLQLTAAQVTLRLAFYRQSVRLGDRHFETHDQYFVFK
jgi:hypothetical protein